MTTNKEIMASVAEVYNRLYRTPFSGDQMMVVSDCIRILHGVLQELNKEPMPPKNIEQQRGE